MPGAGDLAGRAADEWQQEMFHVLDSMKHVNIFSMLGYRATASTFEAVADKGGYVSLHRLVQEDARSWDAPQRNRVILGVAEALEYVHIRGCVKPKAAAEKNTRTVRGCPWLRSLHHGERPRPVCPLVATSAAGRAKSGWR
jgi:hypothetical protein